MTHNTREVDDRQTRSDWQEFWYKESKNTEQSYLTPDTHGIIIDYLKELQQTHHHQLQKARDEEREIIKLRIDYDRRKGIPAEETVNDIYDSIELKGQSELDQDKVCEVCHGHSNNGADDAQCLNCGGSGVDQEVSK